MAALLLVPALLFAQEGPADARKNGQESDENKRPKTAADLEIPDPGVPIEDSSVARREVARFQKEWREAKTREQQIAALDRLAKWDHPEIAKAASKQVMHKDHPVAVAAIVLLARQSTARAKAGATLARVLKKEKRTDVICAALVGLGKLGYDKRDVVREAMGHFRNNWKDRHRAAIRYFGFIKYKPAFRMLAEVLDEPRPARPDDPNNPPASYWKERFYDWQAAVVHARWAISQLVDGETFETAAEAKQWAENHGREHGVEW